MNSVGSRKSEAQQFFSFEAVDNSDFLIFLSQTLIGHIQSRPLAADEDLIVFHLDGNIVAGRQEEAAGLAVHGLRPECSSNQINFSIFQFCLKSSVKTNDLYFDESVFVRHNSFSRKPVVISAHLFVFW